MCCVIYQGLYISPKLMVHMHLLFMGCQYKEKHIQCHIVQSWKETLYRPLCTMLSKNEGAREFLSLLPQTSFKLRRPWTLSWHQGGGHLRSLVYITLYHGQLGSAGVDNAQSMKKRPKSPMPNRILISLATATSVDYCSLRCPKFA